MLQSGEISQPLAYGFVVLDAPGMVITCLVSFLGAVVMFYSFAYKNKPQYDSTYFAAYLIIMGVMSGLANTYNVVVMLVLLEAATVISGVLILFGQTSAAINARRSTWPSASSRCLLVLYGAFILYNHPGSLDVIDGISQIPDGDRMLLALPVPVRLRHQGRRDPVEPDLAAPGPRRGAAPISATMSGILVKAGVIAMARRSSRSPRVPARERSRRWSSPSACLRNA